MSHVERKRKNKRLSDIPPEQWSALFKMYQEGHSINTCSTLFNIGHEPVSERLRAAGIYRSPEVSDKTGKLRRKLIKPGKFADLYK